jgi:RimJ/RimL family protein N-acetyltransferase
VSWAEIAAASLENEHVLLRPVRPADRASLHAIAMDPEIWRYFVIAIETDADFDAFFDAGIADQQAGRRVAYHITDKRTGRAAGSMSFGNLAEPDGRLEIGWSWLGREFRGQGVNRWAKFVMLRHAFERMGAERVEFKTDRLNLQARAGLRNIGAQEEGTLRSFNPMPYGRRRDAVYYSVLRAEWPGVREHLLTGRRSAPAVPAAPAAPPPLAAPPLAAPPPAAPPPPAAAPLAAPPARAAAAEAGT